MHQGETYPLVPHCSHFDDKIIMAWASQECNFFIAVWWGAEERG
jgi:hypothetical protein